MMLHIVGIKWDEDDYTVEMKCLQDEIYWEVEPQDAAAIERGELDEDEYADTMIDSICDSLGAWIDYCDYWEIVA